MAKKDGFRLSLSIVQACGGCGYGGSSYPSIKGVLKKKSGHATQTASYSFFNFTTFNHRNNLSSATVQGTFANGRGAINMTLHATGPLIHPKGCEGAAQRGRRGVLRGTYVLHADRLGKITQKSFRATLWSHYNPPSNPPCSHPAYELSTRGEVVDVTKARATGRVSEAIRLSYGKEAKWTIGYSYLVMGLPGSDYKIGSRLSSAKVTGAGGISGTAIYSGDKAAHSSFGKLSGNLAATMAAIGRLRPFAKHPLHASQYWSFYRTG